MAANVLLLSQTTNPYRLCWSPRLAKSHYCQRLTLSVCLSGCLMSVCLSGPFNLLLLFCFWMESSHFLAVSSPCGTLQNVVLRFFYLGPLLPKIYSPKFAQNRLSRLVWQIDWRCLGLPGGFRGWLIQWNRAKCCGSDPCCHGNEIWARCGDPVAYRLV